jgi:hypothetical protein
MIEHPFSPNKDILPEAQKELWPLLHPAPDMGFVLYGGTAIALRLGHRVSVDFDFFSQDELSRKKLSAALPFLSSATVLQEDLNSLSVLVPVNHDGTVKVSFFGGITFGRVSRPELTSDGVLRVASLDDLMATKVKTVLQRVSAKDYQDVAAMVQAGVSLAKGLAAARAMFGNSFQPHESLKALTYFEGGDLHLLTSEVKRTLIRAADEVGILPQVQLIDGLIPQEISSIRANSQGIGPSL